MVKEEESLILGREKESPTILPLALASTNPIKEEMFYGSAPGGSLVTAPLFDEQEIKDHLKERGITDRGNGFEYVIAVSQEKLKHQREKRLEADSESDETIIVSDSVVIIEENGRFEAVDRDGIPADEEARILERINAKRELLFVGAVSFGRKKGQSAFTVLTYLKIPLKEELKARPKEDLPRILPEIVDKQKGFEAGFINYQMQKGGGSAYGFKQKIASPELTDVMSYIPGLTPEVMDLVAKTGKMDAITAETVENLMEKYPFNSISYFARYRRPEHGEADIVTFYRGILAEFDDYFEKYGGDCYLHALKAYHEFEKKGLTQKIVIYPQITGVVNYEFGHAGLLAAYQSKKFLCDIGLSIPYVIPVTEIPLAPFDIGKKKVLVLSDGINLGIPPTLVLYTKGRSIEMTPTLVTDHDQFINELPEYLDSMHFFRPELKIDYFDRKGEKRLGIYHNFRWVSDEGMDWDITITHRGREYDVNLWDFAKNPDEQAKLEAICKEENVDFEMIKGELKAMVGK